MVTTFPDDILELAEVWIANSEGRRHPVIRTGERNPIPSWVRWAVWERDARQCRNCTLTGPIHWFELDHIIPWSAGGSDHADNLRLLCDVCNQERSNFRGTLDYDRRQRVAYRCMTCMPDYHGHKVLPVDVDPEDTGLAFCVPCGVVTRAPIELTW